jgi:hypothetical protein
MKREVIGGPSYHAKSGRARGRGRSGVRLSEHNGFEIVNDAPLEKHRL